MKYAVYTTLVFAALLLFLPASGTTEIRNLPLLIALLAALLGYIIVRAVLRVVYISRIKQALRECGCSITHTSLIPNFLSIKGRYDIQAKRADTVCNIVLLRIKKASSHCHLEGTNRIEYYITAHTVVHGGNTSRGSRVTKATSTRCIARRSLPFNIKKGEKYVLVIDKMPSRISDRKNTNLFVGDMIEEKILITTIDRLDILSTI